ncbi:MAG: hypothetical protein ACYCXW_12200 [Solirubrobacteraceae bacterium]
MQDRTRDPRTLTLLAAVRESLVAACDRDARLPGELGAVPA